MVLPLFDDRDLDDVDDISKIEIDEEFARRFEHNKRREDLHRLEELRKRGEISDSSEESSSEEEELDDLVGSKKADIQFYDTIVRVKRNDPTIFQKDARLYSSDDEEEEEQRKGQGKKPKPKKERPLYIKDVVAKHLLEEGPEFEEDGEPPAKSYLEEQEENRQAFLDAVESLGSDEEDDLFHEKNVAPEDTLYENEGEIHNKLDEYFGEGVNLDENEMFLKKFFLNKMWIDKEKDKNRLDEELLAVSEEEEELDKQDKYEADYNFRYEEGAGDRVLGHSRFTEGSVRKKSNTRKLQRKSKEERIAQAEFERKEELKRLKNVKKKEIQEKLEKIRMIAGIANNGCCALDENDLDEEFDPDEYDRKMKEVFGTDYYDAADADPGFYSGGDEDLEKPDFDKEDELLGLPVGWEESGSLDGFLAARRRIQKRKMEIEEGGEKHDERNKETEQHVEIKRKRKRKISLLEKVELEKELEEYYKLDYEDTIEDIKTRFKYRSVQPNRYGLNAEEILISDDKDLNQYVSLKKIAPYREDEWKVSRQKRYHQKMKKQMLFHGDKIYNGKNIKRQESIASTSVEQVIKSQTELKDQQSRRRRRRQRQAELKLSQSRLMAYGKVCAPSRLKKKNKH